MAAPVARAVAAAVHEIELVIQQVTDKFGCGIWVVSIVTIDQDVHVCLDIGEHTGDDVTFALQALVPNARTRRPSYSRCAVLGVVVVNIDGRVRQRRTESRDDGGYGGWFIVSWGEARD